MGGGCSAKQQFVVRAKCPGQDKRTSQILIAKLQLQKDEINQLFRAFCSIGRLISETEISTKDMLNFLNISPGKLLSVVLKHLDDGDHCSFNFLDFTLTVIIFQNNMSPHLF
jgi:hypothetical protein